MIKSDFQRLLPEDCEQYRQLAERYMDLQPTQGALAYEIMKESWALAQRWSEISASAKKIEGLSETKEGTTAFRTWTYQRYRQMQNIHDSSRMIWARCDEDEKWLKRQGLSRKDVK